MCRRIRVLGFLSLVVATSLLYAQQVRRPGGYRPAGKFGLLQRETVQADLGLDDDQKQEVASIASEYQVRSEDLRGLVKTVWPEERSEKSKEVERRLAIIAGELEKELQEVLNQDQFRRWEEIWLQSRGVRAVFDPDIMAQLELSDEQKQQIDQLQKDQNNAAEGVGARRPRTMKAVAERMKAYEAAQTLAHEKALTVLTQDQRDKFEKMQGKKADLSDPSRASRTPRRGGAR